MVNYFKDDELVKFNITNDEKFAFDLLREKKILIIPGKGFPYIHSGNNHPFGNRHADRLTEEPEAIIRKK